MTTDQGPLRTASSLVWLPVVLVATFVGSPQVTHLAAGIAAASVASVGWIVCALRPASPSWLVPAGIVAVAAGGVATIAAVGQWSTPLAFCFYAVLNAGIRLRLTAALAVLVGVLAGLFLAHPAAELASFGIVALGLCAILLLALGRRESVQRAEQQELALAASAMAREEHARAAALAERARIARDVHDVLAHSLSALAVQLQGARLMLQRDGAPAETVAQIERAQRLAQDGLVEARRAVNALRSEPVDVAEGLRALVADTPDASLEIDGEPADLGARARETLLRTAQEALSNVRKHAPGAPVRVTLARRDGVTELEVRDRAGAAPQRAEGGYGLVGMAERAALAGATLDAGPVEDGWRVRLVLPDRT